MHPPFETVSEAEGGPAYRTYRVRSKRCGHTDTVEVSVRLPESEHQDAIESARTTPCAACHSRSIMRQLLRIGDRAQHFRFRRGGKTKSSN